MASKKSRAEQASILVLGKVAAKAANALTPFILVRTLGKAEVGGLDGLMLIYMTTAVFLTAGVPQAVLYFLADRPVQERRWIAWRLSALMLLLGGLISLLLLALGLFGDAALEALAQLFAVAPDPQAQDSVPLSYLLWMVLYPLFDIPTRLLPNLLIAEEKPRYAAGVGVIQSIGTVCGTLIPAALFGTLPSIILGLVTFQVFNAAVYVFMVRWLYKGVERLQTPLSFWEMMRFSFPLGVTDIVNRLHSSLDRYLILGLFAAAALAEYKTGAWEIPLITTVAYSVGAVYMPRFVELFRAGKPREALDVWRGSIQKVSLIVIPVAAVFIISAEEFITLAFTEDYLQAAPVFRCYSLQLLGRVAAFGSVIVAAGKPQYVLRAAGLTLVFNLVLSVPLVLTMGFVGPALGTALAFLPTVLAYCWYISRAAGVPLNHTFPVVAWGKVVAAALPGCLVAVALKLAASAWGWHPALAMALESLLVVGGFALVGSLTRQITSEDWRFVGNWLRLKVLA